MEKVLFIGGPGRISTSTVQDLLEENYQVGIFTLEDKSDVDFTGGVRFYWGDRNKTNELEAAFADFKPDFVVDMVCFHAPQAEQVADVIYGKVKHYIFVSTIEAVGRPLSRLPYRESDPKAPTRSSYGAGKRAAEEVFLSRFDAFKFPVTIVRPTYSLGARHLQSFLTAEGGRYLIPRFREGLPVVVPGDGTTLMQPAHLYNTGRLIARIVAQPIAVGKTYTLAREKLMPHDEYYRMIASVVGEEPRLVHVPPRLLLSHNLSELLLSMPGVAETHLNCHFQYHSAFSIEAFKADFPGFKWRLTLEDGVSAFIEQNEKDGTFGNVKEELLEDKIIAAWQEAVRSFRACCD